MDLGLLSWLSSKVIPFDILLLHNFFCTQIKRIELLEISEKQKSRFWFLNSKSVWKVISQTKTSKTVSLQTVSIGTGTMSYMLFNWDSKSSPYKSLICGYWIRISDYKFVSLDHVTLSVPYCHKRVYEFRASEILFFRKTKFVYIIIYYFRDKLFRLYRSLYM